MRGRNEDGKGLSQLSKISVREAREGGIKSAHMKTGSSEPCRGAGTCAMGLEGAGLLEKRALTGGEEGLWTGAAEGAP